MSTRDYCYHYYLFFIFKFKAINIDSNYYYNYYVFFIFKFKVINVTRDYYYYYVYFIFKFKAINVDSNYCYYYYLFFILQIQSNKCRLVIICAIFGICEIYHALFFQICFLFFFGGFHHKKNPSMKYIETPANRATPDLQIFGLTLYIIT